MEHNDDSTPSDDDLVSFARRLVAVKELHAKRRRDVDGYALLWCRECGQNWPCPTYETASGTSDNAS